MSQDSSPFTYSPLGPGQIRLLTPRIDNSDSLTWKLDSVQLLEGERKKESETVTRCDYDALSYTWGTQDETFPITCNGQTLRVHKNLHDALPCLVMRLRQRDSPARRIWIDAVCINQPDEEEKIVQIGLMSKIYRHATQVIVWFGAGRGPHDNAAAVSLIPSITRIANAAVARKVDSRQPEPDSSDMAMPDASSPVWDVVGQVLFNDWYSRLWVLQEIAGARSAVAMVGDSELDFDAIEDACQSMINYLSGVNGTILEVLREARIRCQNESPDLENNLKTILMKGALSEICDTGGQQTSAPQPSPFAALDPPPPRVADQLLIPLFMTTMSHRCADPRDRVFGLLGFAEDTTQVDAIGLRHDMDLTELYPLFLGYIFMHGGRLEEKNSRTLWVLFSYACLPDKAIRLPSWCPDLQVQYRSGIPYSLSIIGVAGVAKGIFSFELVSPAFLWRPDSEAIDIRRGSYQDEIVVKGTVFDTLTEVYPAFPDLDIPNDIYLTGYFKEHVKIGQWENSVATILLESLGGAADKGGVGLDTYWRTLVGNGITHVADDLDFACETLFAFRDFSDRVTRMNKRFDELKHRHGNFDMLFFECGFFLDEEDKETYALARQSPAISFSKIMLNLQHGRQLFRTAGGRFGFGNVGVREGDVVSIFNGAVTPHVLRKTIREGEGDGVYTLVAEAYIHNMMNGEFQELGLERADIHLVQAA
ncbi:hypothetical protein Daus18300_012837 [Diaporthe australafricana]|uniref:Heterokaryon incompatibility domain-containing protein n=1 Tax=Diaporthe australafricana TaxID=127596 RepID=A0ABR3W1C7_9PEZI